MWKYLVRRSLWAVMLVVAVTLVTYVIFFLVPANPARLAAGKSATPEKVAEVEKFFGLDQPVYVQYGKFLERLVVDQSLGFSFVNRQEVNDTILRAAPVTASLVFGAIVFILLIGVSVGVLSALRPRSLLDRAATVYVLIGISLPSIWIGLILSYFVGFKAGITPIAGYCDAINPPGASACGGVVDWAHALILPWLTLAIVGSGTYVRFTRAGVMETMSQDFVRVARAKGAPESRVLRSHILRNALLPLVTIMGMDVGVLLGGAIFIETVFTLPGLGKTSIDAITNFDLPVIQGVVVFGALAIIALNLLVDLLYAWIDPRIRVT
jgi:peptide/nickel transport system permease protein